MFDFGFSELLIIAVVSLVVLGPERLPKATRFVGLWVRRARAQWYSVKDELERDLAGEDLKRNMQEARAALRDAESAIHDTGEEARHEFEQMRAAVAADPDRPPGQSPADEPALSLPQALPADPHPELTADPGAAPAHVQTEDPAPVHAEPASDTDPEPGPGDEPPPRA